MFGIPGCDGLAVADAAYFNHSKDRAEPGGGGGVGAGAAVHWRVLVAFADLAGCVRFETGATTGGTHRPSRFNASTRPGRALFSNFIPNN